MRVQSRGHVDQPRDLSIGRREVANHGRDTAQAVIQGSTKQELMVRAIQLFQAGVSFNQRPFREALHPKRPSQHRPGRRMIIRIVINRAVAISWHDGRPKNAFKISLSLTRSATRDQRGADLPPGGTETYWVVATIGEVFDPFRHDPCRTVFTEMNIQGPQRGQSPRLRVEIVESAGGIEGLGQDRFGPLGSPQSDEYRTREGDL